MKLVLDTNVVMELLHYRDPRSTVLMQAIETHRARCFTDAGCLAELQRVLGYPQFKLEAAAQQAIFAQYQTFASVVELTPPDPDAPLPRCRDADDQKFMELAARCQADLLITRDRELLRLARNRVRPAPFAIVTPDRAVAALNETVEADACLTHPEPLP